MSSINDKTSRRAFFLSGGAALGAGVATTAGAAAVLANTAPGSDRQQQLEALAEREAIRQLHMAFSSHMESRSDEAAADLFDNGARLQLSGEQAIGKAAILELLVATGRNQAGAVHSENRQRAIATWHVDVQISTPLLGSSTAAQMARLQGQVADCHWEAGLFEAEYVQTAAQWKVASLRYEQGLSDQPSIVR